MYQDVSSMIKSMCVGREKCTIFDSGFTTNFLIPMITGKSINDKCFSQENLKLFVDFDCEQRMLSSLLRSNSSDSCL